MSSPSPAGPLVVATLVLACYPTGAAELDDGDWPMAAHDYASTRFSPLDEISTDNVAGLGVAFTFSTGVNRGQEAAPIVVDGTMYLVTPSLAICLRCRTTTSARRAWAGGASSASC